MDPSTCPSARLFRSGAPRARRLAAAVLIGVLAVAGVGCSGDGSDDAVPTSTTSSRATTTEPDGATTTTKPAATTSTAPGDPAVPGGPGHYQGAVDGQKAGVDVTFTRAGDITEFKASGLAIECQPLASGEGFTRTTNVSIDRIAVSAAGAVEHVEADARYRPSLTGSFTPDGSFAGGLYLSGEDDGFVCGGEFTFVAEAG